MTAAIVYALTESISKVSRHSLKHVHRIFSDGVPNVCLQVSQGPWSIVVNDRLQITP